MESQLVLSVLDGMPWPALLIDRANRIVAANGLAKTMFGFGIEGRHYVLAVRQPPLLAAIDDALLRGQSGQARYVVTGPAREISYRVRVSPVAGEDQQGALCVFEDITDA